MNIPLSIAVLLAVYFRSSGDSPPDTAPLALVIALTWVCVIVDVWDIPVPRPWFAAGLVACALTSAIHPAVGIPFVIGCIYVGIVHILSEAIQR